MNGHNNNELLEKRQDYMKSVKKSRKRNFIILVLMLLIILVGGSIYFTLFYNNNQTNNVSSVKDNTHSESVIQSTELSTENTKGIETKELENNYSDEEIEYARVVANVGNQNKSFYPLEEVKSKNLTFTGENLNNGNRFITIMENGEDNVKSNMHILYTPLGNGYIEHTGIRKYTTPPDSQMAKTYLELKYDDIALQLLENRDRLEGENKTDDATAEIDDTGLLNGDFSSVAGVWENGNGNRLEINPDGTTKDGQRIKIKPDQNTGEMITGGIGVEGQPGGAGISFLNKGVPFPSIKDHSDTSKSRIIVAQNVWDFPAEEYYYRIQK